VVSNRPDFVLADLAARSRTRDAALGDNEGARYVDAGQSTTAQEPSPQARRSLSAGDAPAIGCVPCEISRTDGPVGLAIQSVVRPRR
jgi:hypothetical protein